MIRRRVLTWLDLLMPDSMMPHSPRKPHSKWRTSGVGSMQWRISCRSVRRGSGRRAMVRHKCTGRLAQLRWTGHWMDCSVQPPDCWHPRAHKRPPDHKRPPVRSHRTVHQQPPARRPPQDHRGPRARKRLPTCKRPPAHWYPTAQIQPLLQPHLPGFHISGLLKQKSAHRSGGRCRGSSYVLVPARTITIYLC